MARYRKIEVRIWNDAKFRELSNEAKLTFFLLLTHPNTNQLGMIRARSISLAMDLGWHSDAMSNAIQELCRMGMLMVDEKAGLMFLPNFLKYNPPNGINGAKSWEGLLDLLPECDLLNKALILLKPRIDALSEGVKNGIPNDIKNAINNAIRNTNTQPSRIQEQEQEQEQYKKDISKDISKKAKTSEIPKPDDVSDEVWADFQKLRKAKKAPLTATAIKRFRTQADLAGMSLEEVLSLCCQKGWQGFEASWVDKQKVNGFSPKRIEPNFSDPNYYLEE